MDEGTREGREAVDARGDAAEQKSPAEIRRDIDETRAELGDTVEALAAKADVKAQAQGKADELKQRVNTKKDEVISKARAASPDGASAGAQQIAQTARENPLPLAVGCAFVAGLVVGRLTSR